MLTLLIILTLLAVLLLFYNIKVNLRKIPEQSRMLQCIERLRKELFKVFSYQKKELDSKELDSFIVYIRNTELRLYHDNMTKKEFEEYVKGFQNEIQNKYLSLISDLILLKPEIKDILKQEFFGNLVI